MFTDQKPFVVTEKDVISFNRTRAWLCALCGHKFVKGDTARWIYANGTPGIICGNFFVCRDDDADDKTVLAKAKSDLQSIMLGMRRWNL